MAGFDYALGRVDDAVVLEELHTAIEKVMRAPCLPKSKGFSWPELRAQCRSRGFLPDPAEFALMTRDSSLLDRHTHTPDEVLAKLASRRNQAKHEPESAVDGWLRAHWECVAIVVEVLASNVGK